MVFIKALLTALVGVSLCMADISGIVTDTGTTPIAGAVVLLEKGGQTATTDSEGKFTLVTGTTATLPGNGRLLPKGMSAGIAGNLMTVTIEERAAIEVTTFGLSGKSLSTVRKTLDAGSHSISLPYQGAGIYLYKVKSGNSELVLKGNLIGGSSSGSTVSSQALSSNSLAKQAMTTAAINDVIASTKDGYLNYRSVQYNSDTSGIVIKMIENAGNFTDTDGNVYQSVRIGNQIWMVENLRVTKYNDGSAIPLDTSDTTWYDANTPKYCFSENTTNADSIMKYGALYNWFVIDPENPKKIAPAGWHVPSDSEWTVLEKYLVRNGYNYDGTTDTTEPNKIARSLKARTDWDTGSTRGLIGVDLSKYNTSGFSALPGGIRDYDGDFYIHGIGGMWWSATEAGLGATLRDLYGGGDCLGKRGVSWSCGFSIRLVRD